MKVKRFNNLWAMGLILCGVLLVAFYVIKIIYPEFIIGIAEIHPQGTYLLRMNGHITTLIDYTVFDLFDCREYFITNAWEIR